jgi:hypothetical protein
MKPASMSLDHGGCNVMNELKDLLDESKNDIVILVI